MFVMRDAHQKGKRGNKKDKEAGVDHATISSSLFFIHTYSDTHTHKQKSQILYLYSSCIADSLRYSCTAISYFAILLFCPHSFLFFSLSLSHRHTMIQHAWLHAYTRNCAFPSSHGITSRATMSPRAVSNLIVRAMLVRTWTCRKWKEKKETNTRCLFDRSRPRLFDRWDS